MRKSTLAAAAAAAAILVLAVTKDQWMPPNWNREWHEAWLAAPGERDDPREALLEDHRRRTEGIEAEYREKIEMERKRNRDLTRRVEELRATKDRP